MRPGKLNTPSVTSSWPRQGSLKRATAGTVVSLCIAWAGCAEPLAPGTAATTDALAGDAAAKDAADAAAAGDGSAALDGPADAPSAPDDGAAPDPAPVLDATGDATEAGAADSAPPDTDASALADGTDAATGDASLDATPDTPLDTASTPPDAVADVPNPLVVACLGKPTGSDCTTDACLSGQKCAQGLCLGGQPKLCDDGNGCTLDGCAAPGGCTVTLPPPGLGCDDGEACTSVSECQGGACVGVQNACMKDKCIDNKVSCGNVKLLPVDSDQVTKEFSSFSCAPGIATPGPEFVFSLDTPCNAAVLVVVRTWGKPGPGPSAPPALQPTHLYLLDTPASALACGLAMACTEVTAAPIACGIAGPVFKPGCGTEWAFPLLFKAGVPRRLVVDTLAAGWVTDVEVTMAACGCGKPGKCGDATCNNKEDKANCLPDCGVGTGCGNGVCDAKGGETPAACPADCVSANCGNGKCDSGEIPSNCPSDCPLLLCGDGVCSATIAETCQTCQLDCGACKPVCGDTICKTPAEDCNSCQADCGPCANEIACGNTICQPDWGESCTTCPVDCIKLASCKCGDNVCDTGNFETKWNCPNDCFQHCGDGFCDAKQQETKANCAQDCDVKCGDGWCTATVETWLTCVKDCPAECGNLKCEPWSGETAAVCKNDCLNVCGNGKCEPHGGEGQLYCAADCK